MIANLQCQNIAIGRISWLQRCNLEKKKRKYFESVARGKMGCATRRPQWIIVITFSETVSLVRKMGSVVSKMSNEQIG